MSEVTLQGISNLLQTELKPIKEDLTSIKTTQDQHSGSLDGIAKQLNDLSSDKLLMLSRIERHESVLKLIAQKLNLNIDSVLH